MPLYRIEEGKKRDGEKEDEDEELKKIEYSRKEPDASFSVNPETRSEIKSMPILTIESHCSEKLDFKEGKESLQGNSI